jgi:hypothetical protein
MNESPARAPTMRASLIMAADRAVQDDVSRIDFIVLAAMYFDFLRDAADLQISKSALAALERGPQ